MAPSSELQLNGAAITSQLQDAAAKGPDDNRELSQQTLTGAAVQQLSSFAAASVGCSHCSKTSPSGHRSSLIVYFFKEYFEQ